MKNQLLIIGIVVFLIGVRLSGCNEKWGNQNSISVTIGELQDHPDRYLNQYIPGTIFLHIHINDLERK